MKYPFFASFIVLCLWLMFEIHRSRTKDEKRYKSFLQEEAEANQVRRKPLDDLNYITIPFDDLPTEVLSEDENVKDYLSTLHSLSENPIVNLTGFTNTELKMRYGAPNIDILSEYDSSYTSLVLTLNKWGKLLFDKGFIAEAQKVLEFACETNTDITETYSILGKIYADNGEFKKIKELTEKAVSINSLSQKRIINVLNSYCTPPEENIPHTSE